MAYQKRAAEVKDYRLEWDLRIMIDGVMTDVGDTVTGSTWVVETGITKDSYTRTTDSTTIWLSGGTAGVEYTLTNRVTTGQGRTYEQSILVNVTAPPAT